jgi:radical SAM protein with 4Fe4S-binding SPASM domain
MNKDSRPTLSQNIVYESLGHLGALLIKPDIGKWAVVNRTGSEVVKLCDGSRSLEEICIAIANSYNRNYALETARTFFRSLVDSGIAALDEDSGEQMSGHVPDRKFPFHSIYLEITGRCNLNCLYCIVDAGSHHSNQLRTHEIFDLIDQVRQLGGENVVVSGGEPLLREDIIDILGYATDAKLRVKLSTNGMLIDEQIAEKLAKLGIHVQISLDGFTKKPHDQLRGHRSHERTLLGLEKLRACGINKNIGLSMTVTQLNLFDILPVIRLAERWGVPKVNINPISNQGRAMDKWRTLKLSDEQKKWMHDVTYEASVRLQGRMAIQNDVCNRTIRMLTDRTLPPNGCDVGKFPVIDWNGNVYPCQGLTQSKYCIGNVRKQKLKEILEGNHLETIRSLISNRVNKIPKCTKCVWRYFCGGGCLGDSEITHGTPWREDSLCDVRQYLFKKTVCNLLEGHSP